MTTHRWRLAPAIFFGTLTLASLTVLSRADAALGPTRNEPPARPAFPSVNLAASARGLSRSVHMLTALPKGRVNVPIEVSASPKGLAYQWIQLGRPAAGEAARPLQGPIVAPDKPGFYQLAILRGDEVRVVDSLTLGVLMPLAEKQGASINGYRIGFYRGERRGNALDAPEGFLEVPEEHATLRVSEHFSLSDFITHDAQTTWPRYLAIDPRLLDKLELVFEEIVRLRGTALGDSVNFDIHSGFRTPLHNRRVTRAAGDSRHQYGDAADVAIDANGDGRISAADVRLIVRAVEIVERKHPHLVGGLGIYAGSAYAHIDVRGRAARWRG